MHGNVANAARAELDKIDAAVDEATGAADTAIAELGAVTAGIDEGLESTRTVRADVAMEQAAEALPDRAFVPGGRGGSAEVDVVADALARDALTPLQANVGVAVGAIDPADFRRMRDRVHAAMLGRSLERIGDICGRLIGAARRLQLDAAAAGEPGPDTTTPCTLFGDPEALQAFIDSQQNTATTTVPDQPDDDGAVSDGVVEGERDVDGEYVGLVDLSLFEFDGTETVVANELHVSVVDGIVEGLAGEIVFTGPCEGGSATLGMSFVASFGTPVGEEVGWLVSDVGTLTLHASGSCDEEDAFLTPEDFDGVTAPFDAQLDLSSDVVAYTFTFDEGDVLSGTMERTDDE